MRRNGFEFGEERRSFLEGCRRVVIKVGSAVLTSQRGLNRVVIHRLSDQIAELRDQGRDVIIVSSGAIASGIKKLGLSQKPKAIPMKQAAAALGQSFLMQAWEEAFDKFDILVAQILLTAGDLADRKRYVNAKNTIETLLEWRVIPVINENDTVAVDELKFGDNDQLSVLIAGLVNADLIINLTITDGLYTCDPTTSPDARLISTVHCVDRSLLSCASRQTSSVGTGGMVSKLLAARKALSIGIPMIIARGTEKDVLLRLFSGENLGTLFVPHGKIYHGKKIWLAHLPQPRGDLVLDTGAVRALIQAGKSLLPVGIKEVRGTFDEGAPVRCLDENGRVIAVGLTNYRSDEIEKIKGHHTSDIERLLGYCHSEEVIHRDNLAIITEE
ncbi:glutamate 5-kinase [Thermodesulforhabdus norvegica]|uniref:Glutamate 5-kinase n=1 Tax=Thermodesulforhabdus norvegica TaxID=39841 RepID=A0A1I4UAB8_9BACT|nr:glutamate 5-kinase [Thermodesulforhabdus norvegica]SFM85918.1 glutamate 5-kinase [Thermodesulforhabdus norvegica]